MKKVKKILSFGILFLGCIFIFESCGRNYKKEMEEYHEYMIKCQEEGNKALNNGDFPGAYAAADKMLVKGGGDRNSGYSFNRKVLSAEIANSFDGEIDNNTTAAKIILVIKERAKYNSWNAANRSESDRREAEMEMFELAIQVAQASGNDDIATKLQTALDSYKEEKE